MRYFLLAAILGYPAITLAVQVDDWVMYNDGRVGGCYRTKAGRMYSCTPQPAAVSSPTPAAAPITAPGATDATTLEELDAVRLELEALKQRQARDDATREREEAERLALEDAARSAEQRDSDAAMAAFNAIESAKDRVRLRELEQKTEACRTALEAKGYRIMGPGACKAPDGVYMNCPDC